MLYSFVLKLRRLLVRTSILKNPAFKQASRSMPYLPPSQKNTLAGSSDTDLGNQQLNIEKRRPQCTCDGSRQNDDHPRNRIVVAIWIEGIWIPIDLISPFFWEKLQCPGVHNEKDVEQSKHNAEV